MPPMRSCPATNTANTATRRCSDPSVFDFYNNLIDGPTKSRVREVECLQHRPQPDGVRRSPRRRVQLRPPEIQARRPGPDHQPDHQHRHPAELPGLRRGRNASNATSPIPTSAVPTSRAVRAAAVPTRATASIVRGSLFGEVRASDFLRQGQFPGEAARQAPLQRRSTATRNTSPRTARGRCMPTPGVVRPTSCRANPDGLNNLAARGGHLPRLVAGQRDLGGRAEYLGHHAPM